MTKPYTQAVTLTNPSSQDLAEVTGGLPKIPEAIRVHTTSAASITFATLHGTSVAISLAAGETDWLVDHPFSEITSSGASFTVTLFWRANGVVNLNS